MSILTNPCTAFVTKEPGIKAEKVNVASTKVAVQERDSTSSSTPTALEIDESVRDSSGKYILSRKVKVDVVERLSEVPKRWPIPPEDKTVAYVVDLNKDARWKKWSSENNKNIDAFMKQEVLFSPFMKL